jgi:HAD superfamily hydrolase (TIGR01484 family)
MERRSIKAVFFDIDGTLVSFRSHTVPASARRAIERLREQGIKVFIATGRLMRHTSIVSDIEVDGYVTVNGSYCISASGEVIYEQAFPREVVEKVFALEREYGFQSAVMTHENIFVSHIGERVRTIADMISI